MTTSFEGGPADGATLTLARNPLYLRVTSERGKFDALDQLSDKPRRGEQVAVYKRRRTPHLGAFMCPGGYRVFGGIYRYWGEVPDADVRTTKRWRQWCCRAAQFNKAGDENGQGKTTVGKSAGAG